MGTNNLYSRWMRMNSQISPLNASDTADLLDSSSFATQAPFVSSLTGTGGVTFSGAKVVGGTGVLVSGTLAVVTGLTSITSFQATQSGAPQLATGDKSVQSLGIVISGGTGTVTAYYATVASAGSGTMLAATGSSGSFTWLAFGS